MNPRCLFLDTSSPVLMAGLHDGLDWVWRFEEAHTSRRYHSAVLPALLKTAVAEAGWHFRDIQALGVNRGPGSFTGIRTGLAMIRTFAQFIHCPVYGLNTFEVLSAFYEEGLTAVYLDALQGRAFHAVLDWEVDGPRYVTEPALVSVADCLSWEGAGEGTGKSNMPISRILASRSLISGFANLASPRTNLLEIEALNHWTPEAMRLAMTRYGHRFLVPWPEVLPLYLQNPNITPPKNRVPNA